MTIELTLLFAALSMFIFTLLGILLWRRFRFALAYGATMTAFLVVLVLILAALGFADAS